MTTIEIAAEALVDAISKGQRCPADTAEVLRTAMPPNAGCPLRCTDRDCDLCPVLSRREAFAPGEQRWR